jgi:hypothetical protein
MKAVKATFENGRLTLIEPPPESGPVDVLVVFPEHQDDPWRSILAEESPRPAFSSLAQECLDQIQSGQARPCLK